MTDKISVPEAAAIMHVTPQFLRIALQQQRFPFGTAVKMRKQWRYYINTKQLYEYLRIDRKEGNDGMGK
jgi:hypothetical protein